MQTTPKANNILGHFFALLGAVVMLAIATWVSASSSQQVEQLDNLSLPRTGHTATALSDGRILITGGRDADGTLVAPSEIFDPETQVSTPAAWLNTARVDHTATVLADGRVLIAGGTDDSGPLSSAEIFDPANPDAGFQVVASPMTSARTGHTATLLNNGSVLIAGGETGGTAEIFDPATQTFSPTLWNLTVARSGHTGTLFADDSVLLAGGNSASMELFTPLDQKFTLDAATMSVVRTGHWAFELSDTRLLLFQGDTGNSIDEFDPTSDTITPKGSLDFHASSSSLLANGKVLVVGTDVSGLYDPDAVPPVPDFTQFDETTVPSSGILPRSGQSSTQLPGDKKILIAGGANTQNIFQGMALFNPARIWTDRDDYVPGDPVVLSGSGWKANEDVYLYAVDDETQQWTYGSTETAGADGSFVDTPYFIVEQHMLGAHFTVTAVGAQSNMQADVEFTDANPGILTLTPSSVSVSPGNTATYTATVTTGGNSNTCTITLQFAYTGTPPVGTTPSFTPNPLTMTNANVSSSLTIATTNTGPPGGRTQPGTYNFTVTAVRGANCQGNGNLTFNGTLIVTGASPTPTATATATATATFTPTATATATATATSTATATATATFTPTPTPTATAAATNLTVTASTGTYGGTSTAFTATLKTTPGLVPVVGKTIVFTLNGNPAGSGVTNASGVATSGTISLCGVTYNAGTYATGAAASFAGDLSFGGSSGSNSLTVGKANATVVVTPYTLTYDGNLHTATVTSITGVCGETGATVGTVGVSGTQHTMAIGSPYTDTWSFTGTANYNNIAAGPSTTITDTINKKPASVTPNAASKTYGDADPTLTGTLTGFIAADGITATYSRTSGETVAGSPYTISATLSPASELGNYDITYNTANFTITAKSASVTPNAATKVYGDADPAFTGTLTGFLAADNVTATYSRTTGETVAGSPYTISATLSPAAVLGNYNITYNTAHFTITARPASVTPDAASKVYGDADPAFTGTVSGFLAADNVTATYSRTTGETVAGSPYTISATLSPAAVLGNYNITYNTAHFTITPKAASVTPDAATKVYGDADPAFTGTLTGFLAADNVTATYSRTAGETVAGSPYTISATLSPAAVLGNYNITYHTANFTITPRDASVTPNAATKVYGDADPAFTGSLTGFLAADNVTATYNRTTGETVAGSPYTISTTLSPAAVLGNYNITYNTAHFTITPRPASVTPDAATKVYGDADPAFAGTLTGFLAADNVTATYSRTTGETVAGSPYTISATLNPAAVLGNYSITYHTANFTITPRDASVTPNATTKVYGDADPALTGVLTGFLAADNVTATYSRTAGETVAGSPYTISGTLSPAAVLGNYNITYNTAHFTITPRPASVTPDAATKVYGDADPAFTGTLTGFVAADNVTATYSRTAGETVAGSPYTISATLSPAAVLGNYNITYHTANFTVTPRDASVTPNAATKVYGDADPALTGTLTGFVAADNVTATYNRTTGETVAGSPYTISATLSPAAVLGNYNITYNTAHFTITPKAASVTPDAATKVYGDADPAFAGTLTGFLAADNVTATYSRTTGETVAGSPYTISAALSPAGVLGNYNITYHTANFTITPRDASVTPNAAAKVYGDADPAFTGTLTGFLAADNVMATYSRTTGETVAGSPYTISATLSPAAVLGNYNITYNTAHFTITPRPASVTPDAATKVYGDADPAFTGTLTGFVAADNVMATYSRTAGETVAGSPYTISATLSPAAVLGNYNITYHTANFTITPRDASVTPNAATKLYGDADPALTGTLTGFVAADNVTATYSRTAGETVAGSPYTISGTLSPAAVLGNYNITYNTAHFTITPRPASVTPDAATKVYGDADPAFTGTLSGFVAADGVAATYSRTAGETVAGTPYTISATLSPAAVLGNYTITYHTANFTITPRPASATPDPASKIYGDADPAFTGALSGFVASDGVTATYSRSPGETVAGSPYTISATLSPAAVLGNYTITYNTAAFTITPRPASVTPAAASKVYGDADPVLTGVLSGFVAADGITATYSRTVGETVAGSPYTISATLSPAGVLGNYNITYNTASFTITTRPASVIPNAATKVYGDADPVLTGVLSGFVAADGVTATYSRTVGETVGGSPYTISAVLSPAGVLANYNITYNTASFTITPKAASVTPNAASKTYGDADPALTGVLTGFLAADGVTATYSRIVGETVAGNPYIISATLSPAAVLSNYSISYNTANFTINLRNATWTTIPNSKTYGDVDPNPLTTGSGSNFVDPVSATYTRAAGETVTGGPYHITATLSAGAGVLDNYNITNDGADFAITPKTASVTPNPATKVYGGPEPAFTGILSGFLAADGVTATYSRTLGETVLGSPYAISATLSPAGVLSNYTITYNTGALTITPKAASVTPNAATKVYGSADPAFTGTLIGFLSGDGVTAAYSRTTGEMVIGSPYTISATLSPASVLSNYTITYNTAAFTITPKAASVAPNAASKIYGSADPVFTGTLTGFLAADGVTATYSRTSGETVLGGPYTISATLSPAGVLSNYSITYSTAIFTITPKAASVTPNAASKVYGGTDPVFTGTLTGFLVADGVTAAYSRMAGETVLGSPYTISATLSPAGVLSNYSITYNTANFTITPKAATWTTNANSKLYGASDPNPLTTGSGSGFLVADNVTATYSRVAGELPGTYHITATLSPVAVLSNYTITNNGADFSIGYGTCTGGNPGGVILPPINQDGSSVWKVGSTVPVKFTVCGANGQPISDPTAVFASGYGSITLINTVRGTVNGVNESTYNDIPDSAFRWSSGIWIFNMATANLDKNATYSYRIALKNGSFVYFAAGTK